VYVEETMRFGKLLAEGGHHLVYGGGNTGLMGALADSVIDNGGTVTGIIPKKLVERERAHKRLTELIIVDTMHARKAKMAEMSKGFIALPGGLGTFDEFCEILTWNQLGFIHKPAAVLNTAGYYDALIAQIAFSVNEGFITAAFNEKIIIEGTSAAVLERLVAAVGL